MEEIKIKKKDAPKYKDEIKFLKGVCRIIKNQKAERSPFQEGNLKRILIVLDEEDWDIFERILKKVELRRNYERENRSNTEN